jgi:hypothetical protein
MTANAVLGSRKSQSRPLVFVRPSYSSYNRLLYDSVLPLCASSTLPPVPMNKWAFILGLSTTRAENRSRISFPSLSSSWKPPPRPPPSRTRQLSSSSPAEETMHARRIFPGPANDPRVHQYLKRTHSTSQRPFNLRRHICLILLKRVLIGHPQTLIRRVR